MEVCAVRSLIDWRACNEATHAALCCCLSCRIHHIHRLATAQATSSLGMSVRTFNNTGSMLGDQEYRRVAPAAVGASGGRDRPADAGAVP